MYENLTEHEIKFKIKEHEDEMEKLRKLMSAEHKEILKLNNALSKKHIWGKERVLSFMQNQLDESKDEISELAYDLLKNELSSVLSPPKGSKRFYGVKNVMDGLYFDISQLITREIRSIRKRHRFFNYSKQYTIKFKFHTDDYTISKSITENIFLENTKMSQQPILNGESIGVMKKSIAKKIPRKINDFKEIMPIMIELVKFIEKDFAGIVLGCHLSQQ